MELFQIEAVGRYQRNEIINNEKSILESLQWNVNVITPLHFLLLYTEIGILFQSDSESSNWESRHFKLSEVSERVKAKAIQNLEMIIKEPDSAQIDPKILALS